MRPLTHETPKPLLKVGGVPLLEHHLLGLRDAGVSDVVVNAPYLETRSPPFVAMAVTGACASGYPEGGAAGDGRRDY